LAGRNQERPKLKVPYYPEKDNKGHFSVNTLEEKVVSAYSGYDLDRIEELEVTEFWLLLRDAVVYNCQQTEEGRDYLEKCWLTDQTEPDRDALRKYFKKN